MNTTKHTPGPWIYGQAVNGKEFVVGPSTHDSEGGHEIAYVAHVTRPDPICTPESHATVEANARLIAAAPELLAACQALLAEANDPDHPHQGCHCPACQARAAIAKATGNEIPTPAISENLNQPL